MITVTVYRHSPQDEAILRAQCKGRVLRTRDEQGGETVYSLPVARRWVPGSRLVTYDLRAATVG